MFKISMIVNDSFSRLTARMVVHDSFFSQLFLPKSTGSYFHCVQNGCDLAVLSAGSLELVELNDKENTVELNDKENIYQGNADVDDE